MPACKCGVSPLGACSICTPPEPPVVYVLGYSPNNDTVWGVYTSREAVEAAQLELGRRKGIDGPAGWVETVLLRHEGTLPEEPFVG